MLENALSIRNYSYGRKITCKALVSIGLIALSVILPQLLHIALGSAGGVKWLPMYLPVLIGGCLLGAKWGFAVGAASPVVSFLITSAMGNPMPAAARLPFMMAELAVFAVVSGLFTKRIAQNGLWAFAAVISAQLSGRLAFLGLVALFQEVSELKPDMIWQQILTGLVGLGVQAVIAPVIVIALGRLLVKKQ